jgi:predicted nucleic acid-binding protein
MGMMYPEFSEAAVATLKHLRSLALFVEPTRRVRVCSDPDDDKFLELALEAETAYLISGNKKHFPPESYNGVRTVSPAEFLKLQT